MTFDLGARLRAVRELHGLSQRQLAKRAGVTNGSISLIEQNRISPSVGSLKKVLDGIPMPMADFFAEDLRSRRSAFHAAADLVEIAGGAISYRQIGQDLREHVLQMLHERYAPGADTGRRLLSHHGEEAGVVVRGEIEVTAGSERRVLRQGEAYAFDSRLPHRFRNLGPEECEVVSACSPPSF